MRPAGEACVSVQLTALVVWVFENRQSKRIDLPHYRVELFLDQAARRRVRRSPRRPVRSDPMV